jgi:integrase
VKSVTVAPGIRQDKIGYQAYVHLDGRMVTKRFKPGTSVNTMKAWREDQRVKARHGITLPTDDQATFRADVEAYLRLVAGMPTITDRTYRLRQWVAVFGARARTTITATDIRAQLERWRLSGRFDGGPLALASLNQRRTALLHFYTVLDGKSGKNPVRDVPPYPEHTGDALRAQPWRVWYRLLARMGRHHVEPRTGFRRWPGRRERTKGQARLRVMLWTGWPHAQIMQLTPADLDLDHARARVSRRRKGKGHPATWLPLLPPAVTALQAFDALDAWGPFSQSALHSQLRRAWTQENVSRRRHKRRPLPPMRPYDARHSFGTLIASVTTDERALQDLMLLSTAAQARRYTGGANAARMRAAVATVTAALMDR